jgi:hypothetical protein
MPPWLLGAARRRIPGVNVWEFERDDDLGAVTRRAMDGPTPPDFTVDLVTSTGDTITVRVVSGVPVRDPELLVYVERRGAYELVRREDWRPSGDGERARVLLTLRAWPNRA